MPGDKILLVENNPRIIEMLVDAFVRRFNCNITCVSGAADALEVEMFEPHSIAVIDTRLEDADAFSLAQRLMEFSDRPVVLMGSDPSPADLIDAIRCGVVDFFVKPFEIETLLGSMQQAMTSYRKTRSYRQRYERSRLLLRKVIRERRELNERIELICKDLVGAHRRLAMRVLDKKNGIEVYEGS